LVAPDTTQLSFSFGKKYGLRNFGIALFSPRFYQSLNFFTQKIFAMKALKITLATLLIFALPLLSVQSGAVAPFVAKDTSKDEVSKKTDESQSVKAMTKMEKKEARKIKKEERRTRFLAWFAKQLDKAKSGDNDQLIAILLVLFLGGLGIHRVFLKSKGIIVLWYFITLGGIFGIIPLVDLIRFIMGDVDHYRGNNSLFACFQ
jgi:TM2 domain-containing membrane protein YozV